MKFIGSKIKQFCHNLLYLNMLLCIFQIFALNADIVSSFKYPNISAEYTKITNEAFYRDVTVTKKSIFLIDDLVSALRLDFPIIGCNFIRTI